MTHVYATRGIPRTLETAGAWLLGLLWILPLAYAGALTMVLLALLGAAALAQFWFLERKVHYQ